MSEFADITFKFRRGTKADMKAMEIKNGSFNFCYDTDEFWLDIDNMRVPLSGILTYDTEDEIKALTSPEPSVYLAADTGAFLLYNRKYLRWTYCGSSTTELANRANMDSDGNIIVDTYETRESASEAHNELEELIESIKSDIVSTHTFEIEIVDSLPATGESQVIYFMPTIVDGEQVYEEYIWLNSSSTFEKIGISTANLEDYYTKTETDNLLKPIKRSVNNEVTDRTAADQDLQDQIDNIKTIQDNLNEIILNIQTGYGDQTADMSIINTRLDQVNERLDTIVTEVSELSDRVTALETATSQFNVDPETGIVYIDLNN